MSVFEYTAIAVSLILGLAIAQILESSVGAFRARRACKLDWLPFCWAGFILVHQYQFWWGMFELSEEPTMQLGIFILLLLLAGLLFIAGSLVLPGGEAEYPKDLGAYFTEDGA